MRLFLLGLLLAACSGSTTTIGPSGPPGPQGGIGASGPAGAVGETGPVGPTVQEMPATPTTPSSTPSAAHFAITCERDTLSAADSVACSAHVGDRFGQLVENAKVSFRSEAGLISAHALSDASGRAATLYSAVGAPPTLHLVNGASTMQVRGVGTFTNHIPARPFVSGVEPIPVVGGFYTKALLRSVGQVRLMAMTRGEEGFIDANGNGAYDAGEAVIDTTEPFIDKNGNGVRDDCASLVASPDAYVECFEDFFDTDGDHTWDGGNATWDGDTMIWSEVDVTWAEPATLALYPDDYVDAAGSIYDTAGLPEASPSTWNDGQVTPVDIGDGGFVTTRTLIMQVNDQYYNCEAFDIVEATVEGIADVVAYPMRNGCSGSVTIVEGAGVARTGGGIKTGTLIVRVRTHDLALHNLFWPLTLDLAP